MLTRVSAVMLFLGVGFLVFWHLNVDDPFIDKEEFMQGVIVGIVWCVVAGIGLFMGMGRRTR